MTGSATTAVELRPFHVDIPEEALEDLRRRIAADAVAGEGDSLG